MTSPANLNIKLLYIGDMNPSARSKMWSEAVRSHVKTCHTVPILPFAENNQPAKPVNLFTKIYLKFWYMLRLPRDTFSCNDRLLAAVRAENPDWVWVHTAHTIKPQTLETIKKQNPSIKLIFFSEDDMYARHNSNRYFDAGLKYYDLVVTNKSYNCDLNELPAKGASRVFFINNTFNQQRHRPYPKEEGIAFGAEVGFIGSFEQERANSMLFLAENGIKVRIWGNMWPSQWLKKHPNLIVEGAALSGFDFPKAICATRINLCFLRKKNRDLQTTRSIEIPACGAFMLAERSDEHQQLFKEGIEADYFSSDMELLEKTRHYLSLPERVASIGAAGRARCIRDGYDMKSAAAKIIQELLKI